MRTKTDHMKHFLLITLLLLLTEACFAQVYSHGGLIRGNTARKQIALVFTGHEYAEGGYEILKTLKNAKVKASFFLTGDFYRNSAFSDLIGQLKRSGHYLGPHSDKHLLYCAWEKRDSLLVSKAQFVADMENNYRAMEKHDIRQKNARVFMPPYEWYNDSISVWAGQRGIAVVNYSPGTLSAADYTTPDLKNYRTSDQILQSILALEQKETLNGFILLVHIGTAPERTDKFYRKLPALLTLLKNKGYTFEKINFLTQ